MATAIKAIETRYKGYRFRSRLEARWAVFLDEMGEPWEYEVEGFDLGYSNYGDRRRIYYLPDFYLPNFGNYIEIKGQEPTKEDWEKMRRFAQTEELILIVGSPGVTPTNVIEDGMNMHLLNRELRMMLMMTVSGKVVEHDCSLDGAEMDGGTRGVGFNWAHNFEGNCTARSVWWPRAIAAYNAARSARFEFGESGAR